MSEKWTLEEGMEKLLAPPGQSDVDDLMTYECRLILDISFAEVEVNEIDGCKVDPPEKGINVLLTCDALNVSDDEQFGWHFSKTFLPASGETLSELIQRIAKGLGIDPTEKIWQKAA